jgi:polynucleotide 5'-hydroxyl-kinase GRC3/NOL9
MQSALAARKARLGAGKSGHSVAVESTSINQSSPSSSPEDLLPDLAQKRKLSETNHGRRVKKRRMQPRQRLRYFAAEGSSDILDEVLPGGQVEERPFIDSDAESTPLQEIKSPHSQREPSQEPYIPPNDSSDADMDTDLEPEIPTFQDPLQIGHQPLVLSTFQPLLDKNTFYPSHEDLRDMGLQYDTKMSVCMLSLNATDTLTLLGTYTITVLRGFIHFCGVQLKASKTSYPVFAPKCSALPTLKSVPAEEDVPEAVVRIPERIRASIPPKDTLVLVGELGTGVESLGQVCQIFDSIFSSSVEQPSDYRDNLKLAGLHMVGNCVVFPKPLSHPLV